MSARADGQVVGLDDIRAAATRIERLVLRTPVVALPHPTRPDDHLYCKAESLQPTGAFKLRGAYNAISQVMEQAKEHGIVAQSSGNHGRAIAWLAQRLSLRAVVVMPDAAPTPKVDAVRALGAEVVLVPAAERDTRPLELVRDAGYVYVPPYDDLHVIAGQGTVGLELIDQLRDVDVVLVPVSGGGLISGVATAVKSLRPDVTVIGVEPELAADAAESLRSGRRITWAPEQTYRTVADGLRTTALGVHSWEHVRRYVDDIVTVTDDQIRAGMRHLAIEGRLVAEPAGAVAASAWMHDLTPRGAVTSAIVSGGSVDPRLFAAILGEEPGRGASTP